MYTLVKPDHTILVTDSMCSIVTAYKLSAGDIYIDSIVLPIVKHIDYNLQDEYESLIQYLYRNGILTKEGYYATMYNTCHHIITLDRMIKKCPIDILELTLNRIRAFYLITPKFANDLIELKSLLNN